MTLVQLINETQDCGKEASRLFYAGEEARAFKVLKHLDGLLAKYVTDAVNQPPEAPDVTDTEQPESPAIIS